MRAWQVAGLPSDSVSTENGIILAKARRWPLVIDPQGQASKFIKNIGREHLKGPMPVLNSRDRDFAQSLEACIRFGQWVLLEEVEQEPDASLDPLLLKQMVSVSGLPHVHLGDKIVPYSDKFHLYMTTSLPNPCLLYTSPSPRDATLSRMPSSA